jgi:hypothetical protein
MRLLIATAICLSALPPCAFAQNDQKPTPAPATVTLQSTEQQHPDWFVEKGTYKPCPWNMCPSPR